MTIQKINIGVWEEGTPQAGKPKWHYFSDDPVNDPLHAVITGPITGNVTITHEGEDHTYDVTEHVIEAPPEHHGLISHAIGVRHEEEGHPSHAADSPFVHECSDHCGEMSRASADSTPVDGSGE